MIKVYFDWLFLFKLKFIFKVMRSETGFIPKVYLLNETVDYMLKKAD